eukprot:31497-Pelagococcus_subviridis.AAC.13
MSSDAPPMTPAAVVINLLATGATSGFDAAAALAKMPPAPIASIAPPRPAAAAPRLIPALAATFALAPPAAAARADATATSAGGTARTPTPMISAAVDPCCKRSHSGAFSRSVTAMIGTRTASSVARRRRSSARSSAARENIERPNTSPLTYLLHAFVNPHPSSHRSFT